MEIKGQISLFDYLDSLSEKVVETFDPLMKFIEWHLGSHVGSKDRIIAFFKNNTNKSERIKILKDEYGVGGFGSYRFTPDNSYSIEGGNYDAKGIEVHWYEPGKIRSEYTEKNYSYSEVADAIDKCINDGIYHAKYEAALSELNDYEKQFSDDIASDLPGCIYYEYKTLKNALTAESDKDLHEVIGSLMQRARGYGQSWYDEDLHMTRSGYKWETQQCVTLRNIAAKCFNMDSVDWQKFYESVEEAY